MAARIRNALTLYHPLMSEENIEIRLHRTVLYNSIYRADNQLLVNQHTYGQWVSLMAWGHRHVERRHPRAAMPGRSANSSAHRPHPRRTRAVRDDLRPCRSLLPLDGCAALRA